MIQKDVDKLKETQKKFCDHYFNFCSETYLNAAKSKEALGYKGLNSNGLGPRMWARVRHSSYYKELEKKDKLRILRTQSGFLNELYEMLASTDSIDKRLKIMAQICKIEGYEVQKIESSNTTTLVGKIDTSALQNQIQSAVRSQLAQKQQIPPQLTKLTQLEDTIEVLENVNA
jgi:hypothetical protein